MYLKQISIESNKERGPTFQISLYQQIEILREFFHKHTTGAYSNIGQY